MQWIKDRLREPSTYKGMALLLGAAGIAAPVDVLQALGTLVAFGLGLWETARREARDERT